MSIKLDDLEATAKAATPGPWNYDTHDGGVDRLEDDDGEIVVAGAVVGTFWPHGASTRQLLLESSDALHIATFDPPTALALIAKLREAEAVAEKVRAVCDQWNDTPDYTPSGYDLGRVDQRHEMTAQMLEAIEPTNQEGSAP